MLNVWETNLTASHLIKHLHCTIYIVQEETVTPVILYCMYAKQKGYKNARKRTSVSDISFICLYYAKTELQVKKYLYWYRKRQQQTIN